MLNMYWEYAGTRYKNKFKVIEASRGDLQKISFHAYPDFLYQKDFTSEPHTSYKELLRQRALQLRDKYKFLKLYFSGGQDSITMLNAFVENNIFVDQININLFGSENSKSNIEANEYAIPFVKKHFEHTKTKISLIKSDLSYYDKYLGEKWLQTRSNFSIRHFNVPNIRGKNYCNIFGYLDPTVYYENGKYYHQLFDGEIEELINSRNIECFFSSPDFFELHIKQLHIVKNFIKFNDNREQILDLYYNDQQSYLDIVKKLCRDNALYSNKIYHKGDKTSFANQKDRIVLSEIPQFLKDRFRYSVSTSINRVSLYRHLTKTYGAKPICLGE
jgi:hypothetical protein